VNRVIIIAGPTASGKTALSIEAAKTLKCEIISADSRQFYRQMNIGTAKPTENQLKEVRHHLINSLDVSESYNAGRFEADALKIAENIFANNDKVIMTGGSGLYIDAFCNGIDQLPQTPPEIREELNRLYKTEGIDALRKKLKETDPEYYSDVDLNNPHRIIRALEVIEIAGKKFSAMRTRRHAERSFTIEKYGILVDREELYKRINDRVDQMIRDGLIDEVKSLMPYKHYHALQTVGYKEIFDYLENKLSLDQAIFLIRQNTRNYAKRQMTWFRKDQQLKWYYAEELEEKFKVKNNK